MSEDFNLEEQLRAHLLDGTEPTPPDLFAQIEAQIKGKERRKKRFFIWFWFGAGLAVIALGILLSAFGGKSTDNDGIAANETSIDSIDTVLIKLASIRPDDRRNGTYENEIDTFEIDLNNPLKNKNNVLRNPELNANDQASNQTEGDDQKEGNIGSNLLASTAPQKTEKPITNSADKAMPLVDLGINPINNPTKNNDRNRAEGKVVSNVITAAKIVNVSADKDTIDTPLNLASNPNEAIDQTNIDPIESSTLMVNNPNSDSEIEPQTEPDIQNVLALKLADKDTINTAVILAKNSTNNSEATEIDSTTFPSKRPNELQDTTAIAENNVMDSTIVPAVDLARTLDLIQSIDSTLARKTNRFGLIAYGGYLAFDQAVFKPYFTSGLLSQVNFPSLGTEFGLGAYYRFNKRFEFSLIGAYGQRNTSFNYDLMISESDFFEGYENDQEIPLENLDDPTSCNCFLAQDARLDYSIQTIAISLNASFDLIQKPKYSFGSLLGFGTVANTKFTNNNSSIIAFSPELKERFASSILRMGLNFHYQFTPKMQVGLTPSFNLQFAQNSNIYGKDSRLLLVPLQLKWAF